MMPAEQESPTATLTSSPPPAFPDVGSLLWRRGLWREWLDEHPNEGDLLAGAYRYLVRLTSHTGWDEDRLLKRRTCETSSDDELRKLATERLGLCSEYFAWVERLLLNLDVVSDKRLTVSGAARLFAAADQDLGRCEAAFKAGVFPPLEYLRLGEVAKRGNARFARFQAGEVSLLAGSTPLIPSTTRAPLTSAPCGWICSI